MEAENKSQGKDSKKKVLLIDDEEDFCFFVKLNLQRYEKFEVLTASNGLEGIKMAIAEAPDIILLDIIMPEISGAEVADQLLENDLTKDIPILFVTAIASRTEVTSEEGVIGGRNFIAKPVTYDELAAKIESILRRRK